MNWPPDYLSEFNRRIKLFQAYREDPQLWADCEVHYANNPVDWINDFCVTYDPRNKKPKPKLVPFVLFKRQEELVECVYECIHDGESLLVEKCRDAGVTWVCSAISAHLWRFHGAASVGWGSRKEQLVDKIGDRDSIFEKIRIIVDHLPSFSLPKGYESRKHSTYMKLLNPEDGSTITGEAGDNIGRGGRKTVYFKDESAHYERPEKIEAALGDNTDVQIDISSVNGTANVFYRRRQAGQEWYPGSKIEEGVTRVFIFDWRDHPLKDQAWYDRRRKKAEAEGLLALFAQEVDRDYASAVEGIIIKPEWVKAAIDAHIKLGISEDGEKVSALDVADEGRDRNAWAGRYGVVLKHCESWGQGDTGETTRRAILLNGEYGINEMYYDCIGVGAGVKADANRLKKDKELPRHMRIKPWNAGANPINPDDNIIKGDKDTPKNKDYFENLSAQGMWLLAQRFYKTYLAVNGVREYPHDELISISSEIPHLHEIEKELSQPTQSATGKGKMIINKKPDGTKSPNYADTIKMCYCPVRTGVDYEKLLNSQA